MKKSKQQGQKNKDKLTQKLRLADIAAYELYFEEDLKVDDRKREFQEKFEKFCENCIDVRQHLPKLIQQLYPNLQIDELTTVVLSQVTLLYIQELLEAAKVIATQNSAANDSKNQISQQDIQEAVRRQNIRPTTIDL